MKTIKLIMACVIMLSTMAVSAQKFEVNTEKSSIHWLGKKIGGQHDGFIQLKSGSIELQQSGMVAGNFVVDMTTITNTDLTDPEYNKNLVGHLKSDDFFGVDKYPTATFVIKKSSKLTNGKVSVSGELTIKGQTETVTFAVTNEGKVYSAKVEIDRSKFNVRYGSNSFFDNLGDKAIDDIFTLDIKLVVN